MVWVFRGECEKCWYAVWEVMVRDGLDERWVSHVFGIAVSAMYFPPARMIGAHGVQEVDQVHLGVSKTND